MRARRGRRDHYQPLISKRCATAEPLDVVRGLLAIHPFGTLYIADLDAIRQRGNHLPTVAALRDTFPQLNLWVDAGFSNIASCAPWQAPGVACVIGSESQVGVAEAARLIEHLGRDQAILSLDSLNSEFKGPASLFETAALWPDRIIAMNLDRVGSHAGPDFDLLQHLQQSSGGKKIYAAGGVRHGADLRALADRGIAGALIASALHDEQITARDLSGL